MCVLYCARVYARLMCEGNGTAIPIEEVRRRLTVLGLSPLMVYAVTLLLSGACSHATRGASAHAP